MVASLRHLLTHQHILLIQGKMGSFFSRFASFLMKQGIIVSKINLNAGDAFFYQHHERVFNYKDSLDKFNIFLKNLINNEQIDAVVCFGDCRPHHMIASKVCQQEKTSFFVFEEGYLRPDYITFQEHGINGYSRLDVSKIEELQTANDTPLFTDNRFYRLCFSAIIYYIIVQAKRHEYPHYHHYRDMSAWQEAMTWLKAPFVKFKGYLSDKNLMNHLEENLKNQYFVVCLQVYNDSQITYHSDYRDIIEFIDEVIISFAKFAPKNYHLVFKHHPLDRAHRRYGDMIAEKARQLGIAKRVHYGCDMHLPTLIKHSSGMVIINSTTGLQSIYHQKPTKAMGRAIYNIEKLTDQQPLDSFWQNPKKPDHHFYLKFREYLIEQTQLNGSFYGKSPWRAEFLKNPVGVKVTH